MSNPYGLPPKDEPHGGDFDPNKPKAYGPDGKPIYTNSTAQLPAVSTFHVQRINMIPRRPVGSRTTSDNSISSSRASTYAEQMSPTASLNDYEFKNIELKTEIKEVDPYYKSRVSLAGYRNAFPLKSTNTKFSAVGSNVPHFFQESGYTIHSDERFRHQDSLQRVHEGELDDRYLDPRDGRVRALIVQCTDRIYHGPRNSTYKRTFIRNVAPKTLRLANWNFSELDDEYLDPEARSNASKLRARLLLVLKWPVACFLIDILAGIPGLSTSGDTLNDGGYNPFPYRHWGFCKVTRNTAETTASQSFGRAPDFHDNSDIVSKIHGYRALEPRKLCFLEDGLEFGSPKLVDDWIDEHSNRELKAVCPEYLFIAYTTQQFSYTAEDDEDLKALHAIATKATRQAGLIAYWVSCSCLRKDKEGLEDDVCRISDVVRGAHSLVIAIKPSKELDSEKPNSMLEQWGGRVWTLPEVLLIKPESDIAVWKSGDEDSLLLLNKKQFAKIAWTDSSRTRQLIDHYEGTLSLSRLELVIIAMRCLFDRSKGDYLHGDHSYALMGLLRLRPKIDASDSDFQAFARLSLANDSDLLLERLVCVLPADPSQDWHDFRDAFGVNIWDIYPNCQIAGICNDDTVLIDGAFGATIHWDKFQVVACRQVYSWSRMMSQIALHGSIYALILGIILVMSMSQLNIFIEHVYEVTNATMTYAAPFLNAMNETAALAQNVGDVVSNVSIAATLFKSAASITKTTMQNDLRRSPREDSIGSPFSGLESAAASEIGAATSDIGSVASSVSSYIQSKLAPITSAVGALETAIAKPFDDIFNDTAIDDLKDALTDIEQAAEAASDSVSNIHDVMSNFNHTKIPWTVQRFTKDTNNVSRILYDISDSTMRDEQKFTNAVYHLTSWAKLFKALGYILFLLPLISFVVSPLLARALYRGKFRGTQAWLFGFEGYADLETIETQIFGSNLRRLRWSPFGSTLSRHITNQHHECIGVDPVLEDASIALKVENRISDGSPNGMRIFTIVDTNTMTVTLFEAVRPPVAVLLCGTEGGMQRAIGCSYDWTTGTCYRETVLRMETPVIAKMERVSRFRFGMKRASSSLKPRELKLAS